MKKLAEHRSKLPYIIITLAVVVVGTIKLLGTHAADPNTANAIEICENTPISGKASIFHDHINASCGHGVQFGYIAPANVNPTLTQVAGGTYGATSVQVSGVPGDNRLFVGTQDGKILISNNDGGDASGNVFLDISGKVLNGGEQGFLGVAFDPNYASNGYVYVDYSTNQNRGTYNGQTVGYNDTVISRFTRSSNNSLDPNSELIIMGITQPQNNHNGGDIFFGADKLLYISHGDGGGGGGDQHTNNCSYGNAQCLKSYLGKILRIDVSGASASQRYKIPPSNPFVNRGDAYGEVWQYGLRNPWQFSIDKTTNDLFIGDVGEELYEEFDYVADGPTQAGSNFGWPCYEGNHPYRSAPGAACENSNNLVKPIFELSHPGNGACSSIGGIVYRGNSRPQYHGTYIFSDTCTSKLYFMNKQLNGTWALTKTVDTGFGGYSITSFGTDLNGEMYLANRNGSIFRIILQ